MDNEDRKDIIKKVNTSGNNEDNNEDTGSGNKNDSSDDSGDSGDFGDGDSGNDSTDSSNGEEGLEELSIYEREMGNLFLDEPKRNNMFQEGSNDILEEYEKEFKLGDIVKKDGSENIWKITNILKPEVGDLRIFITAIQADGSNGIRTETYPSKLTKISDNLNQESKGSKDILDETKPCWKGYKQVRMKEKNGREVPNCVPIDENHELTGSNDSSNNYMFWQNLKGIYDDVTEILGMNQQEVDALIANGHQWALEHVITSKDDVEEVYHFIEAAIEGYGISNKHEMTENESNNYMFWSSLKTIQHASKELLEMDYNSVDTLLTDGHGWALDHIATSADDMEEVYHFLANTLNAYDGDTEGGYEDEYGSVENVNLNEAEYKGRKVKLGKPTKGDIKKFKVFVKNKKGKVVKVNFGDPNMEIKRDNPKRRKSFRARHKCAQAKDRTTPKYWSCKMWSSKPVSKIVGEELKESLKNSIFDKNYFKMRIQETFNHGDAEPMVQPQIKPDTKPAPDKVQPNIAPSRKNKPFLPMPEVKPDPKAMNEGKFDFEIYHKTLSSCFDEIRNYVIKRGYDPIEFELYEPQHVAYGQTQRYNKELTVNGKLQRKGLHIQIYRMDSGNYELNMYIN
jgi:hypothetical protein